MSQHSPWDHSLLRKFNATSHFRLLSKLKTELKAYPIKRIFNSNQTESRRNNSVNSEGQNQNKNIDAAKTEFNSKRELNSDHTTRGAVLFDNQYKFSSNISANTEDSHTFRERLREIDMR